MEILEFGNKDKRKIILIHGFQMPYQIWNKYIEYYKNNFHIIVLISELNESIFRPSQNFVIFSKCHGIMKIHPPFSFMIIS